MDKLKLPIIGTVLALLVIITDRVTDYIVYINLINSDGIIAVTPFFNFVWGKNDGVSFGMLQGLPYGKWWLSLVALIIVVFFFVWLLRTQSLLTSCALGLIIGGALGNTCERIYYGYVIDILDFHIFGYHWPAFNITDSTIFIGVLLLLFIDFFRKPINKSKGI